MPLEKFKSKKDVFEYLAQSSIYGNLGLFIGSGLPMAVLNSEWHCIALSWKELIEACCEKLEIEYSGIHTDGASYPDIASQMCRIYAQREVVKYETSEKKLKEIIAQLTCWYPEVEKRLEYNKYLNLINPNWIITTNYDLIIEAILTGTGYSLGPNDSLIAPKGFTPVYHLHGIRTNPDSIIITQEDYTSLFRPNQYRQQKLPLILKESVTLLLGYNLGDFNVLTAVDWSRNVFNENKVNYPQDIIQFYFTDTPKKIPYRDHNNVIIVEFSNLSEILADLCEVIKEENAKHEKDKKELDKMNEYLMNPSNRIVEDFIDDEEFRKEILVLLKANDKYLISGFLELFSKCIDVTWERSRPRNAFYAYDENLTLLLDTIEHLNIKEMPPALVEAIVYNLNSVAYYVGTSLGHSRAAHTTWQDRKAKLSKDTLTELKNIATTKQYYQILSLLNK